MKSTTDSGHGFSRRSFVTGAMATGGIIAAGALAACVQPEAKPSSTEDVAEKESIAPSQTMSADIVVVGAGLSGLSAGVEALDLGKSVILLEKTGAVGGNGNGVGGIVKVKK